MSQPLHPTSGQLTPMTAEQAFLRDAVRDIYWARRGLLGLFVRLAAI